jgi:hypothetical protein
VYIDGLTLSATRPKFFLDTGHAEEPGQRLLLDAVKLNQISVLRPYKTGTES